MTRVLPMIANKDRAQARYEFLDGLRFLCATWVTIGHLSLPDLSEWLPQTWKPVLQLLIKGVGHFFNGSAAVMAFFIISGFCIHLTYVRGKPFAVLPFYAARIPRILIPTVATVILGWLVPNGLHNLEKVIWSLYCELIYYISYPLLRMLFVRHSTGRVLLATYMVSIVAAFSVIDSPDGGLSGMGIVGSTVYGFPVWVMGCWIAELVITQESPEWVQSTAVAWAGRFVVLLLCPLLMALHFHSPLHYQQTMVFFSVPCGFWIYAEFRQKQGHAAYDKLAAAGAATFSIYLVHMIALSVVDWAQPSTSQPVTKFVCYLAVFLFAWAFYRIVEKPSHGFCRHLARKLETRSKPLADAS